MMKQRAGLGKKVSSIFDGVPLPGIGQQAVQAPRQAEPQAPPVYKPADIAAAPRQMPTMPPQPSRPSPYAGLQKKDIGETPMPRPQPKPAEYAPAHKAAASPHVSGNSLQQLIHKIFFSGNSELDAKNRRTAVFAVVLLAALISVLALEGVFSGLSSTSTSANGAKNGAGASAGAAVNNEASIGWTTPEPYPANLRDPMQIGSTSSIANGGSATESGGLVVKSIIYVRSSPHESTTVINGQILRENQSISGAKIVKINQDSVEFAASGKSWKQQVE
jgi:hypothetical protein